MRGRGQDPLLRGTTMSTSTARYIYFTLAKRKALLESAKAARPERWSRGIQNLTLVGAVTLNPEKVQRLSSNK